LVSVADEIELDQPQQPGRRITILPQAAAAVLLGVVVRRWRGFLMLDPFFFLPFACASVILVGPYLAELHRKKTGGSAAQQVQASVLRACGLIAGSMIVSLILLNVPWHGSPLLPGWALAIDAALLSFTATAAAALGTQALLARFPASSVKWFFRIVVLTCLFGYLYLPPAWSDAGLEHIMSWGVTPTVLAACAALALFDILLFRRLTT
jgi:hypothetical protein